MNKNEEYFREIQPNLTNLSKIKAVNLFKRETVNIHEQKAGDN